MDEKKQYNYLSGVAAVLYFLSLVVSDFVGGVSIFKIKHLFDNSITGAVKKYGPEEVSDTLNFIDFLITFLIVVIIAGVIFHGISVVKPIRKYRTIQTGLAIVNVFLWLAIGSARDVGVGIGLVFMATAAAVSIVAKHYDPVEVEYNGNVDEESMYSSWICKACGSKNIASAKSCTKCGASKNYDVKKQTSTVNQQYVYPQQVQYPQQYTNQQYAGYQQNMNNNI